MKHFCKYLAICIAIAIIAAVAICCAAWSFHSLHRFIWFVICAIVCLIIGQYLANPDYVSVDEDGKKCVKRMSKAGQVGTVVGILVALGICGSLVWAIGYGVASLFEWQPKFWEMYLLYGALTVAAVILAFITIAKIYYYCDDFRHDRYGVREYTRNLLMWIFAALCGVGVAGTILYFLFPLALRY
ncbi:MAG: hypothetical protein IJS88_05070 [Alphaproteobacteria bacterium]|nr:hypothetical protein [Alphaproteobacteria bacterium]